MSLFRYSDHVWSFGAFFGHFWTLLANFGPKVKNVVNWSYDHSEQSQDEQKSDGDGLGCHLQTFRPFFWSFRAFFGHFCPILAPNSKLLQTSHVTTQNDRKRSRNPMEMVSDVTFRHSGQFRSFGALFGHFWPILAPNSKLS